MADALQFDVLGKKNLLVYRSGAEGTGLVLRIAFTVTRRRWKCLQIDLGPNGHSATWSPVNTKEDAVGWVRFSRTDAVSAPQRIHPRGRPSSVRID
jgi:hypothetical protein